MSKMTDEQIIKHIFGCENKDCRVIVIFNKPEDTIDEITIGDIADVINRQQAENNRQKAEIEKLQLSRKQKLKEIERLQVKLKKERHQFEDLGKMYSEIRAEAIKECLGKIEQMDVSESDDYIMIKKYKFDNLTKEMVGEQNDTE